MNVLVIFVAALLGVQAVRVPNFASDSSEEEYHILLPPNQDGLVNLPGVGIVNQPVVKAVKVKVPRYADPLLKQHLIEQYLAARGLTLQSFAGQDLETANDAAAEDLDAHLDNFYNLGLGVWQTTAPQSVGKPTIAAKPSNTPEISLQLQTDALVIDRRPTIVLDTSTISTLDTTTTNVPDVNEIVSTMTELPTTESITEMLDATTTPVSSTDTPPTEETTSVAITIAPITAPETEPFVKLFGVGSLVPASVSRVSFVPRIPINLPSASIVSATGCATEHKRLTRAVTFNNRDHMQLTKATPVPPVPKMEARTLKVSDLLNLRKLRAVPDNVVDPIPPPELGSNVAGTKETATDKNCDIPCTKFDLNPVCAFNGECYHQFANQCMLDTFICKRPDLGFEARPKERCALHWLKRCNAEALKGV